MDSGGTAGRWNRAGRLATDPPGPHALTKITPVSTNSPQLRLYPYDPNGNMTNLDGMVAMWDFKDRLVALENTEMRADYTYDFSDRRITKKVFWKHGEPTTNTNQPAPFNHQPSTTTVTYVGKHFEVREHEAPTKYVWNGNTRVARVTGTLSPNTRLQRVRVAAGWNLISVAVTAPNTLFQLSNLHSPILSLAYKWDQAGQTWLSVSSSETLPAGSVLWLSATTDATLRVTGVYPGPMPNLRAPPEGAFLPSAGLEPWNLSSTPAAQPSTALWFFSPDRQIWQTRLPVPLTEYSDFSPTLPPGAAFFVKAPAPSDLELPDPALGLRFYHQDHLGSSSCLTDTQGQLVEEAAKYPFGVTRNQNRARGIREEYQFTQKEEDDESGLAYFEVRILASVLGRFTSIDPLRLGLADDSVREATTRNPQALNLVVYCLNNPLRFNDPTGLQEDDLSNRLYAEQIFRGPRMERVTFLGGWEDEQSGGVLDRTGVLNYNAGQVEERAKQFLE